MSSALSEWKKDSACALSRGSPAATDLETRDVPDPELVRAVGVRRPEPVRGPRVLVMNLGFRAVAAQRFQAQARDAHEAGDAPATHAPSGAHEQAYGSAAKQLPLARRAMARPPARAAGPRPA
jgi:hypothetical protein